MEGWMRMSSLLLLAVSLCGSFCWAGPSADLITSLPGQPNVLFAQYAGYIDVDASAGRSFFYYLAEAEDASSKPLTLWLNGGPGCSSVGNGGFTENGPFRVCSASGQLKENQFAWNTVSNMLYLDSPAGVGWSYTNTSGYIVANDTLTAQDNFIFLQNWFEAFPEYKGREFFITGESYAGHYVPQLASLIVDYMTQNGTSVVNLVGLAIGNPLLDGLVDFPERNFFLWSHAVISDSTYRSIMENCNYSVLSVPNDACVSASMDYDREVSGYIDEYDILIDVCLAPNITGLPYRWSYCNEGSLLYDESGLDDSMLPTLSHILEHGVSVLVYSGDEDSVIPFGGTRRLVDQLAKMNGLETSVPYSPWLDGGQVGGWTQVYGRLSYATVRGGGHMVPFTSPGRALTLFKSFLAGGPLPSLSSRSEVQRA
ncbi:hypothetical protein KP509_19G022500 [Ceratopteris richardii]|uniref:Carboxypeptidase n=1 Tax=Ceratopteris richardii TaxID=49495 RepID=A0A8T2SLR3_CERRI|nr:hypothetical protein KP509_19G022500 [Ceratopteris richardii]